MRRQSQQQDQFEDLNNQQKLPQIQSVNQIMLKLQKLSEQIENNPHLSSEHLKQYITVYVQNHNRSEEFFNLMCEHNMLAKLFTGGVSRPIYVLETFNLLLANTQRVHELVYIFSHPLFHNYLLINVESMLQPINTSTSSTIQQSSLVLASHQCIEYYIQLIKTLITKLQAESSQCTLLKLFCNSKYSYYPLLANCIVLAIKRNIKQQLVRVTAQHCILQLVGIMARKQVGEYYFSNIHMLVFFYQIINETIEQQTQHSHSQDTTIKYLTDLLKAINLSQNHQAKEKSFILFFTIFSNLLVFKFMKNPAPGLHMLLKFSNSLSEIQQLKEMPSKYLTPVYFIYGKLLFNKYLNNITLSSIILATEAISELSELKDINILKIIKTHYQKNPLSSQQIQIQKQRNSYEQQKSKRLSLPQSLQYRNSMIKIKQTVFETQYQQLLKQLQRYNMDNQEFFSLKQNFHKKSIQTSNSNWLFGIGNLFKKINIFDIASNEYMKRLAHLASVKYIAQQPIRFLDQILSPSAVYMYEFLKIRQKQRYLFGQKTQDTEKIQISFNQNRDEFVCSQQFFKVVMMITQVGLGDIDLLWGQANRLEVFDKLQHKFNRKLQKLGEVYFMLHFRQYFQHSIFQYICTNTNGKLRLQLNTKLINYFFNLSSTLLFDLSQMNLNKLKAQTLKLQKQLYSIINQKGFQAFCQYLQSDQQKHMVQSAKKPSMNASVIKFDKRQSTQDPNNKMTSSARKKKSIFKSFTKSSSSKDSPKKNLTNSQIKQSQTLKIVQTKMIHLQLLRFLLQEPQMGSSMKSLEERRPLYKIFENNFTKKYLGLLEKSQDQEDLLYQAQGVGFNSQSDYECTFRVRVNFNDFTIVCELLHQQKLILKCNIKQFSLSQPYMRVQKQKSPSIHDYLINLYPTTNTLGFKDMGKAIELLNTVNEIKFGFREIKDLSILQYLNKENQRNK